MHSPHLRRSTVVESSYDIQSSAFSAPAEVNRQKELLKKQSYTHSPHLRRSTVFGAEGMAFIDAFSAPAEVNRMARWQNRPCHCILRTCGGQPGSRGRKNTQIMHSPHLRRSTAKLINLQALDYAFSAPAEVNRP